MRYLVAADTGGTFTDCAVFDRETRRLGFGKTLTTYGDLVDGVLAGIAETGTAARDIALLRHGTTRVINAFLQRRERIAAQFNGALRDPALLQRLAALGAEPIGLGPDEFRALMVREVAQFRTLAAAMGVQPE